MLIEHHEGGGRPQRAGGEGEADQECEEKCEAPDGGECNQKGGDQKLEFNKTGWLSDQNVQEQSSNVSAVCSSVDQCLQLGKVWLDQLTC